MPDNTKPLSPYEPMQEPTDEKGFWNGAKQYIVGTPQHQTSALTKPQQESQYNILQSLQKIMQDLVAQPQNSFQDIANQQETNFQTRTIPSLAERFTALGAPLSSGGYREALGRASSGLHENLASMGAQYGQNQRSQSLDLLRTLLTGGMSPSLNLVGRQAGAPEEIAKAILPMLGAWMTSGASLAGGAPTQAQTSSANTAQIQGHNTNDYLNSLFANNGGMNANNFFQNAGITRG
jgi:hypothetical protein